MTRGIRKPMPALATSLLCLILCGTAFAQGIKYDSHGKRDPFQSLLNSVKRPEPAKVLAPPPLEKRPPGLAGLLVSEVTLTGTAKSPGSHIAILRGIDNVSYFAREGTKLYNGYVEKITDADVVFVREQVDTTGKKTISRVTKQIQTENRQVTP
jgi:Tfp pilus assembly protein PilP